MIYLQNLTDHRMDIGVLSPFQSQLFYGAVKDLFCRSVNAKSVVFEIVDLQWIVTFHKVQLIIAIQYGKTKGTLQLFRHRSDGIEVQGSFFFQQCTAT